MNSSQVFDAEKVIAHHGLFHKTCYKCADCQVPLDSTRACDAPNKEVRARLMKSVGWFMFEDV